MTMLGTKRLVSCLAVAGVFALLPVGAAYGQPVAGDKEIQLSAGFFKAQDVDAGSVTGDVSLGYFLNRPFEIGLRQGLSYTFIDHDTDVWTATSIPFINYHIYGLSLEDRFVPFVGAFVGAVWNDRDATGTAGPNVGAKVFISDQTFVVARYRYEFFFDSLDSGGLTDKADNGNHVATLGLGFVWGGTGRQDLAQRHARSVVAVEAAGSRAERAADRAENAATKAEGAASRIEKISSDLEASFQRSLRK